MFYARFFRNVCLPNVRNFSVGNVRRDFVRSVDQNEVDYHTQYASEWWDEKEGPMVALHSMNAVRIPLIRGGLVNTGRLKEEEVESRANYLEGIKVLDVGCGGGILSLPLARLGADVTGIDPSRELVDVANREALSRLPKGSKFKFLATTIEEHEQKNKEAYDVIVLSEVLEHVTKKEEFLNICIQALKPAGSIFFTTINRTMASWLGAIFTAEYVLKLLPRGTHDWDKFPTPDELKKYLERADCKTLLSTGICYQPLNNEWYWTPNTSINYVLHAVKHV